MSTTPTLTAAAAILKDQGILLYYSDYRRANFSKVDETYRKRAYGGHADDGETSNVQDVYKRQLLSLRFVVIR